MTLGLNKDTQHHEPDASTGADTGEVDSQSIDCRWPFQSSLGDSLKIKLPREFPWYVWVNITHFKYHPEGAESEKW